MGQYASGTAVSEEKSRQEIEALLAKRGASKFGVMTDYQAQEPEPCPPPTDPSADRAGP